MRAEGVGGARREVCMYAEAAACGDGERRSMGLGRDVIECERVQVRVKVSVQGV